MITDPTYLTSNSNVVSKGKAVRAICILDHPIPNTNNSHSGQIFIPKTQLNRKNGINLFKSDITLTFLNHNFFICKKGFYVVFISTLCETSEPEKEIAPAISLIGNPVETFISVSDLWESNEKSVGENVYVTSSLSAESDFEKDIQEVLNIYRNITGKDFEIDA